MKATPQGLEFLKLLWDQEDHCEQETTERLPGMGEKAPLCLKRIGTVLLRSSRDYGKRGPSTATFRALRRILSSIA